MLRACITLVLLVLGAVALARGLYLQAELKRQLDTGTMGYIRSWIMWSTTDGRVLVAWYRQVTPWLIWGGAGTLAVGLVLAVWPEGAAGSRSGSDAPGQAAKAPRPRRKPRGTRRNDA